MCWTGPSRGPSKQPPGRCLQGEDQKKLDVVSNEVFSNALRASGRTGVIASEEEDVPVAVEETNSGAPWQPHMRGFTGQPASQLAT